MQRVPAVIVGAGQAGLAVSCLLTAAGLQHVVLERGSAGQRWRSHTWESLRLLTPNWLSRLPGWRYAGPDPAGFMTAGAVADHLAAYAAAFGAPVTGGIGVGVGIAGGRGMTARWDVVVVGARVAGAATALLLARSGLRVLCLERARPGSDTVSTHALMRAGVLQLRRWGLLDAVVATGTPAIRRTVFHYGTESVPVTPRPAFGVDALRAPRRTVLDSLLADAAAGAGATVRFGTAVTALCRDAGGRVTGVVTRDRRGRVRTERAGVVIGADGRDSLVAGAVGAEVLVAGRASSAFVYGYWADLPSDGYEWFYRPGSSAGTIPTNDGLTCVFVCAPPAAMDRLVAAGGPGGAVPRRRRRPRSTG